jgi:hypothetical protein
MENEAIVHADSVREMLRQLSLLWQTRAAVNLDLPDYWALAYDSAKSDFSASLLPFKDHPSWIGAPSELKSKALSYAWAIYNLKTIYIECNVVTPACEDFIKAPPRQRRSFHLAGRHVSSDARRSAAYAHVDCRLQLYLRKAWHTTTRMREFQSRPMARKSLVELQRRLGAAINSFRCGLRERNADYRLFENHGRRQFHPTHLP